MDQPPERPALNNIREPASGCYALEYRAEKTPGVPQTIIAWLTPEGDDANGNSQP